MHELVIERGAEKEMRKLPPEVFRRASKAILALRNNPRPSGCRKLTGGDKEWRIRVGDYRVVYAVDDSTQIVRVVRVRHRGDVYR